MIYDEEKKEILTVDHQYLERMTKLSRKTWRIKVLRYSSIIPREFYEIDPKSHLFKRTLKQWVGTNIPPEGDHIFKGKILPILAESTDNTDWLVLEQEN